MTKVKPHPNLFPTNTQQEEIRKINKNKGYRFFCFFSNPELNPNLLGVKDVEKFLTEDCNPLHQDMVKDVYKLWKKTEDIVVMCHRDYQCGFMEVPITRVTGNGKGFKN